MPFPADMSTILRDFLLVSKTGDSIGALDGAIDDDDATAALAVGFDGIRAGSWPIKIDSEIMLATETGGVVTFEPVGRGALGTTAASHLDAAPVVYATFSDIVGAAVFPKTLEGENTLPGATITVMPALRHDMSVERGRALLRVYGGKDGGGTYRNDFTDAVAQALLERMDDIYDNGGESLTGGFLSTLERDTIQFLDELDIDPPWPVTIVAANVEARLA